MPDAQSHSREQRALIFERIEKALGTGTAEKTPPPAIDPALFSAGAGPINLPEQFTTRIGELGDRIARFADVAEARAWLLNDLEARERGLAGVRIDPDAQALLALPLNVKQTQAAEGHADYFAADCGITLADFGIAQTGTVALSTGPDRHAMTSLAPPHHYVLLFERQLLPDLAVAVERHRLLPETASIAWITGSSRTADIDGILVHGAHGPKGLTILLVAQSPGEA